MEEGGLAAPVFAWWQAQVGAVPPLQVTTKFLDSTTNRTLREGAEPNGPMRTLARRLIDELLPGGPAAPAADLVIAVDDAELANFKRENVVIDHLRRALEVELQGQTEDKQNGVRALLAERAAFVFARPMVEAWFFAGAPPIGPAACPLVFATPLPEPLLLHPDPEEFEGADPAWKWEKETPPLTAPHNPAGRGRRHAEKYLLHLIETYKIQRIDKIYQGKYRKMREGVAWLKALDFDAITQDPIHSPWLRSLVDCLRAGSTGTLHQGAQVLPLGKRSLLRNC
jgi:hypothetical protein